MRDLFVEIWESIRRNKLRTCLTGFAVAWGIFMLIILLGAGNGLKNNVRSSISDAQLNYMTVYPGFTSKPYEGLKQGRYIELDAKDLELTKGKQFASTIDEVAPVVHTSGVSLVHDRRHVSTDLMGVTSLYNQIRPQKLVAGRFINANDEAQKRKSIVLSLSHVERLFDGKVDAKGAIGRKVILDGLAYTIVGVYKTDMSMMTGDSYIAYSTLESIYAKGKPDLLSFTFHGLESEQANEQFEDRYRAVINRHHRAAPDDRRALWISNSFTRSLQMDKGMNIITVALWIVGLFTLLSGIVGVSNIMLITVKERTHEFGIRKAIGASPWSVVKLIIAESVSITAFFGYIGMLMGMLGCEYLKVKLGGPMEVMGESFTAFKDPTVGLDVAIEATLVLIIAGTLAGLVPAIKAGRVRPIEALRAD
ncbi:MAG: ABC transporter permease [Bacteroidales bacterium]|nr:ABC transporter permease [Bacteroidales bacterium]